jgi:aminoglycoside 6-adenylyltransferase
MRSEQEMFDLILQVARRDDRIRAVYMNGSRTNPQVPEDIFQDYDIAYVVKETESFIQDKRWIKVFGEMLIMQQPDELDKIAGEETHFEACYGYLMQFVDGNRIDLHIATRDIALKEITEDKLTIVLLDKDQSLPAIPAPTDEDYWVKMPTKALFYRCCNEFWWVFLYVAKGLWREEIPYAMDHLNFYVRPQLVEMISWYVGMRTDYSCSIGKNGKYLHRYLPEEIWQQFLRTYPHADIPEMWDAAFIMGELFEQIALEVSKEFGFSYDKEEGQRCIAFARDFRQLPKDAKEIR